MKKYLFSILLLITALAGQGQIANIRSMAQPGSFAPSITVSTGSLSPFSTPSGTASATQTFIVNGYNLTTTASVASLSGYEYSQNGGSTWASSLTLAQSGGTLTGQPITITVRLAAADAAGTYNGNIAISSTGASTQNVAVTGSVSNGGMDSAYFSFSATAVSTAGYVNVNGDPSLSTRTGRALINGDTIDITTNATTNWTQYGGACTVASLGVNSPTTFTSNGFTYTIPATVAFQGYYQAFHVFDSTKPNLTISKLKPLHTYRIFMTGSDHFEVSWTDYYAYGMTEQGPANPPNGVITGSVTNGNTTNGLVFLSVNADASGVIRIYVQPNSTNSSADGVISMIGVVQTN